MMDGTALLPLDFAPDQKTTPDLSPLIVDSFAGGGGASTGIEMALGRSPDVAINHDENALAMYEATPRELFRAQGFPDDYVIAGVWREDETGDWSWKPFAKHVQVSGCGNSVPPRVVEALVSANFEHLSQQKEAA